jgi:hypothetical protein
VVVAETKKESSMSLKSALAGMFGQAQGITWDNAYDKGVAYGSIIARRLLRELRQKGKKVPGVFILRKMALKEARKESTVKEMLRAEPSMMEIFKDGLDEGVKKAYEGIWW